MMLKDPRDSIAFLEDGGKERRASSCAYGLSD